MLRRLPLVLLVVLLALPVACGGSDGTSAAPPATGGGGGIADPAPVPTVPLEKLVIQPGGGRAFLLDALAGAEKSVRVVAYALTDDAIEDALVATAARGIDVRAILPGDNAVNAEARAKLARAGIPLTDGNPAFALTHEKAVVVDDDTAFVLTQNLSWSGFEINREFDAMIRGEPARDVAAIFDADWTGATFAEPTDLVVSPTNSRARLVTLIDAAQASIDVAMEVLTDDAMMDHLIARAQSGVAVRVLLEDPAAISGNAATGRALQQAGVQVRWLPSPDLHAKAVVTDGRFAYIGSVNFTWSSLGHNRELGLVTADEEAVARIAATFDGDFANGRADF